MRALIVLPLALLIGCKGEPSFDERYDAAERTIREKANAIDAELKTRASQTPNPAVSDDPGAREAD